MESGNWEDFYRLAEDTFTQRSISRLNQLLISAKIDPISELKFIPDNFLRNAYKVTQYTIPDNCTDIGNKAFAHSAIQIIRIPVSVKSLGFDVFFNCYDLTECIFETTQLPNLPDGTFDHCTSLKKIILPQGFKHFNIDCLGNVDRDQGLVLEFGGTADEFRKIMVRGFCDTYFTVKCTDETFGVYTGHVVQV